MEATANNSAARVPWNKDKLTGQKSSIWRSTASFERAI
ncbi:hypothetical protein SBC1_43680 (plasmid) [Caballeronia sp. SBC1]|nr:hypothetical protein SBC2_44250 [Caballeronia sp. SBC2]QIN64328.1 hypothetical protein SBC1_43680 [Caballeronia sp. SBC1]